MLNAPTDIRLDGRHIVLVEDELALANVVKDYLAHERAMVSILCDGTDAARMIIEEEPDLAILDIMLPGRDGFAICRDVRRKSAVPIIMLTAKVEEIDRLLGLELGADDYICKPFSPRELIARTKAVLRRSSAPSHQAEPKHHIVVDPQRWSVMIDGNGLDLTRREFLLFEALHRRPGRVFSRAQLLDLVYTESNDVVDRTIDSHIKNIRGKAKRAADVDPIRSVYGVGYAFEI